MRSSNKWASLWTTEDWWPVWLGFVIILGAGTGLLGKQPMMGEWLGNPGASFGSYSHSAPLTAQPDDLAIGGSLAKKFSYDAEKKALVYKGLMSAGRRDMLKTLSKDAAYQAAVDPLYASTPVSKGSNVPALVFLGALLGLLTAIAIKAMGDSALRFLAAFGVVFLLAYSYLPYYPTLLRLRYT